MTVSLLVIYTRRLEACVEFYSSLGLRFGEERHGEGPRHFAAVTGDGFVLELYPAGTRAETGRLRIGFTCGETGALPPGTHLLRDPDGRTVEVTVP
ncbi:VOC family protein [Bailinhaonella thermotolerans]|uniref:VOC family protein n=1 Tax=Bailinhaonella thermotolerans TaxID=1070861 RepID=A0A3A3ZXX7_9ACTN|nr:VOC family protein [Bailinhaonella thermotolerans]RJL19504.1 VOC family protein [Bailinhaonella thermotolerans]